MSNLLEAFEKKQIEKLTGKKRIPTFRPGDTLKVTIRITEGDKSRLQAFEGMCIARKNNSVNSNFTVRKLSHGCLLYTSPSPRDISGSRMPSSA